MAYSVSWPKNTFLAEFVGTIAADEIEAVNYAFSGDERMETVRYSIWDFSRADAINMPLEEIEDAAAFDKGVSVVRPTLRGALIVCSDLVRKQIEAYMATADDLDVGWDIRIFDNISAAKLWLEGHS